MVKKMFVRKGEQITLVDLVIDETDLDLWKSLMIYYPIWDDINKNRSNISSVEEYAEESCFDIEKDAWIVLKLLKKILNEDNPLVISDSFKKLCEYVPKNEKEKIFVENIINRFSFKISNMDIKRNNNFVNTVAGSNYLNANDEYNSMIDEMIENEKDGNPNLSKKKEKRLRIDVKKSIPRKNCLL